MKLFQPTHEKNRWRKPVVAFKRSSRESTRGQKNKRGVALIMVLVITTVMSAIAADLSNEAKVNVTAAANARDQLQAYFHARSAVELELFLLRFQAQVKTMLEQFVPIPLFELSSFLVSSDTMKGILTRKEHPEDGLKKESFALDKPFGQFEGSFEIEEIVDENRKINLNLEGVLCNNFVQALLGAVIDDVKYDPLFENVGDSRDPIRNRIEILANITDWVDGNDAVDPVCAITGDQTVSSVSEDTRYDRLPYNVRYKPKNGLMTSLSEVRMVPGVNDAFMQLFGPFLTVWSDKKGIGMQTADERMLRAVVRAISGPAQPGDDEKFAKFMEARSLMMMMPGPLGKLNKDNFVQLLTAAQINFDQAKLTEFITREWLRFDDVASVFRVTAVGRVNNATSTITVVWRDDRAAGELLYWHEE